MTITTKATSTVIELPNTFNQLGESPVIDSPKIMLSNGKTVIPQQFFHYERSRSNVEHIMSKISYDQNFPLFVHEENDCLFVQVGIVGHENYPKDKAIKIRPKIVYGRRWYIEPYTPTSEVIQTAYIAIQKAREHELREFLYMSVDVDGETRRTTPLNTHIDLPLMTDNANFFVQSNSEPESKPRINSDHSTEQGVSYTQKNLQQRVYGCLEKMKFMDLNFKLQRFELLGDVCLISVELSGSSADFDRINGFFPEQTHAVYHIVIDDLERSQYKITNILFHEVFESILKKSNDYVSENFCYDSFARFDKKKCVKKIAEFSVRTRLIDNNQKTKKFINCFKRVVATADGYKAPMYAKNENLYQMQRQSVNMYANLDGYLPYVNNKVDTDHQIKKTVNNKAKSGKANTKTAA